MTIIDEQVGYLTAHLASAPARILDAGCGRGELALALRSLGHDVTAIDIAPPDDADPRVVRADIATFEDDPFDAVVFSLSLHHVRDLAGSAARARALTRPGGVLIVDEMAWEQADKATATWFYDTAAVLGLHPVTDDPQEQWQQRHHDEHPMHTGEAMASAIADHFDIAEVTRRPYLHRYLAGWGACAPALEDIEQRRIADRTLTAVGLRLTAR